MTTDNRTNEPTEDDREAAMSAAQEGLMSSYTDHWPDIQAQIVDSILAAGFSRAAVPDAATEQVEAAAKALHETRNPWFEAYGDWGAAGYEIKQAFRESARVALVAAQGAAPQAGLPEIQHLWNDGVTWCGAEVKPWYPETRDESRAVPVCTLCHSRTHHHYAEQVKMLEEKVTELVGRQAKAPVLPSSGVDEGALAEVIRSGTRPFVTGRWLDDATLRSVARAVAEWLKGQGQ